MNFDDFNLDPKILKALTEAGYTEPTKIQEEAIPKVIEGDDIRGSAQTGTGKTAAFLLPALNLIATKEPKKGYGPRVLILAPTRELAMQIAEQADKYSKHLPRARTVCIGGGVPYHKQTKDLSRPYDILVATPGRLIDFMHRRKIAFPRLEMLVLDEADRMLDMGFLEPVEEIVSATPASRQTLLFSATLDGKIAKLSAKLMRDPTDIVVHHDKAKHDNITQQLHYVDNIGHKNRLLNHILGKEEVKFAIIFTATKRHADQLVDELQDAGHDAAALHGDMNQRQRTRTIAQLRNGRVKFLVATDVAARGIDVLSITHVINFDLPRSIEDYVHRIGRTGRAGAQGTAISFAGGKEGFLVRKIEQFTGQPIEVSEIPGFEPRPRSESAPRGPRGPRAHGGGGGGGGSRFRPKGNGSKSFQRGGPGGGAKRRPQARRP